MSLEFGIWDHFELREDVPIDQEYRDRYEFVALAEKFGFYSYQVAEHHMTPLSSAPSPNVYLAALAQHTSRIRLGTMVTCLPFYHPVRLIQEICMLDQISGGRLDLGVGRGIRPIEHEWFGLDPEEAKERFDESLAVLIEGLATGHLAHQGKYYNFANVTNYLRPYQKPYPPLWYAGTLETAARMGMNVAGAGNLRKGEVSRYWEVWSEARKKEDTPNPHVLEPRVGSLRWIFVGKTDNEALTTARRAWHVLGKNFVATPVRRGGTEVPTALFGDAIDALDKALDSGWAVVGSPATVSDRLGSYLLEVGPQYNFVLGAFQWGDLNLEEVKQSLTLFGREVIPALRTSVPT